MYCFLMRAIQTQSIIADITDEHEWEHGLRQEAGFFAASNFANKVATVVGPLYGGLALDVIGLTAGMRPGEVAQPFWMDSRSPSAWARCLSWYSRCCSGCASP
jgi:GPH family glycoside/pentoside/hexuronide:cation symporter